MVISQIRHPDHCLSDIRQLTGWAFTAHYVKRPFRAHWQAPISSLRFFTVYGPPAARISSTSPPRRQLQARLHIRGRHRGRNTPRDAGSSREADRRRWSSAAALRRLQHWWRSARNFLDYISTLQEELVRAGVLPKDYDFQGHRQLVGMQPGEQSHMRTAPVSREITASHRRSGSARA